MSSRFLNPEEVERVMKLAESSYRPKEILDLENEINGERRVAEVRLASTGVIDEEHIHKIVNMMLQKDALYCAWARGEIK